MCNHLDSARAAIKAAGAMTATFTFEELLEIARVQAQVSQAASLARLVEIAEANLIAPPMPWIGP